ncbi:MAG: CoA-transferase subunit beta [Methanomassiliicoccales archaeon]
MGAPANPLEMLAYVIAKQIHDHTVVYVGTGLPMVGAYLAAKTHAPNITLVFESGAQDPLPGDMPWSVCDAFTWRKSPMIMEMPYSFGQVYNGYVDIAFLGGAQIDQYGNVNTTTIGDLLNPKVRLTGSGGNNDLASLSDNLVLVGLQDAHKFPARCDFITSVGWLEGHDTRKTTGLIGKGPSAVISQFGIYDFEPVTKRMRVKSLHPGISFELTQQFTGFELLKPEGEIPVTEVPSDEILEILRKDVDPRGVFTKLPGM